MWLSERLAPSGESSGGAPGPFGFPMRHIVVLSGLILALLLVYVIGKLAEDVTQSAASTQRVETLTMPPLATPEEVPGTAVGAAATSAPPADAGAISRPLDLPRSEGEAPGRQGGEAAAPRPIIARPATGGSSGVAAALEAAAPAPAQAPAAAGQPPAPAATRVTPPSAAPVAPPPPAARPPASAAVSASGGSARNASWILGQPATSYTVQLVSLSSAERALAYIAQQPDPGSFATYRMMRNGQLFHVVIYGAFASKAQADQAAARLPASVGNIQPWVRTFGQVQESIRTTPQQ